MHAHTYTHMHMYIHTHTNTRKHAHTHKQTSRTGSKFMSNCSQPFGFVERTLGFDGKSPADIPDVSCHYVTTPQLSLRHCLMYALIAVIPCILETGL